MAASLISGKYKIYLINLLVQIFHTKIVDMQRFFLVLIHIIEIARCFSNQWAISFFASISYENEPTTRSSKFVKHIEHSFCCSISCAQMPIEI